MFCGLPVIVAVLSSYRRMVLMMLSE